MVASCKIMRIYFSHLVVSFFFIIFSFSVYSQIDTVAVYSTVNSMPPQSSKSVAELSKFFSSSFNTDAQKILAISYWISQHISYKHSSLTSRDLQRNTSDQIIALKKASSYELSQLMSDICSHITIPSVIVYGFVKDFDFLPNDTIYKAEHYWNIVKIDSLWNIIDLTLLVTKFIEKPATLKSKSTSIEYISTQAYSPQWISVNPKKNIETHFPILPEFQLLSQPISMSVFIKGIDSIRAYLSQATVSNTHIAKIDKFYALPHSLQIEKTASMAMQPPIPSAYTAGISYFYEVSQFYSSHYMPETDRVFAKIDDVKFFYSFSQRIDSLLNVALVDGDNEFKYLLQRSELWKKNLQNNNRLYQQKITELAKSYSIHINKLNQLDKQKILLLEFFKSSLENFNETYILNFNRPDLQKNTDLYSAIDMKMLSDSIHVRMSEYRKTISHTLEFTNTDATLSRKKVESDILKINIANTQTLQNYVLNKEQKMPLIYKSETAIEKKPFVYSISLIDSLHQNISAPFVQEFYSQQSLLLESFKQYNSSLVEYSKLLLAIKSKLNISVAIKEDSLYNAAIADFKSTIEKGIRYLSSEALNFSDYQEIAVQQNAQLSICIDLLKQDSELENIRHQIYVEYRKNVRQEDKDFIKSCLIKNKEFKKNLYKAL